MEEYDDLVPTPEANGTLELTYRGWTLVDDVVWTMGRELLILDIAYNAITELPPELGDLMHLKELNCAFNKLQELPKQIGKLNHLKALTANGNKLTRLPDELGNCKSLERLLLGENAIQAVPLTLSTLRELQTLQLCNNRLTTFPPAMCLNPKLTVVDLLNNPGLQHMIPTKLQEHTEFILWMCRKWYAHKEESTLLRQCNKDYEMLIDEAKVGVVECLEAVDALHKERRVMADLMPRGLDRKGMEVFNLLCVKTGCYRCSVM